MRLSVAFLVVLALVGAAKGNSNQAETYDELVDTLAEFKNLIPEEKFDLIFFEYLYTDSEFQNAVNYVQTNEFKDFLRKVNEIEDVKNLYDYLVEAGFDAYGAINSFLDEFNIPHVTPGRHRRRAGGITGGINGYMSDIRAILPTDKIKALHEEKLKSSPVFARFVEYLMAPRFQELLDALRVNEEFQRLLNLAKEGGIDVKGYGNILVSSWGVELPKNRVKRSTELRADFREFHALVDTDKLLEMSVEYLKRDPEAVEAYNYLWTDEFKDLLRKVNGIEDVINFYDYLEEAGLNVYDIVNMLQGTVGFSPLKSPRRRRSYEITGGPAGYIADLKALLPLDKIKTLHQKKLETSPAFARFVKYWRSPHFKVLVDALRANEELQNLLDVAKEAGIDVRAIADLYATLFGLEFPEIRRFGRSPNDDLTRDLSEFGALLPDAEVSAMIEKYLENDAGFAAAFEYSRSDAFKNLVRKFNSIDDVIKFYDYLEEAGLDIYTMLNRLNYATGLPPVEPRRSSRSADTTTGASRFITDFKALLPVEKIKALHNKKLETSPAFSRFVEYWKSPRFQERINALRSNEEVVKLLQTAKESGIDALAVVDLYVTALGLEYPS